MPQPRPAPGKRAPAETLVAKYPCPASGFAEPHYAPFIGNSATTVAYEIASPCIPKEVLRAAEAVGMAREKPVGVKNVTSIDFTASGPVAAEGKGGPIQASAVRFSISYVTPGFREEITGQRGGKPAHEIRVLADGKVWNEMQQGVGELPATGTPALREPLVYLTPFGAMWGLIQAEGQAKVSTKAGRTVIEAPTDEGPIVVTLDQANFPVEVSLKAPSGLYQASFGPYSEKWEPPYLVPFPERLTWKRNGAILADLTVRRFNANTYLALTKPLSEAEASK